MDIQIATLLLTEGEGEMQLEELRQQLASLPGFNAKFAFALADGDNTGQITAENLLKFMSDYGSRWDIHDADLFIKEYDYNPKDGILTFKEFQDFALPLENERLSLSPVRDRSLSPDSSFKRRPSDV